MTVAVTQYLMPDGRRQETSTKLLERLRPQYEYMLKRGWNFGAEVLTTGHISVTIEDRKKGEDVEIRVIANGPGVQSAMEEMLEAISRRMKPKKSI